MDCVVSIVAVLNALRHQWFGRNESLPMKTFPHSLRVLNALRHQWFGRVVVVGYQSPWYIVLNALRHQWFGRSTCPGGEVAAEECSTPLRHQSGLAGRNATTECSAKSVVLNALRHQWFGRCSMIGYSTIEQIRAQRLAASVVWQGPPSPRHIDAALSGSAQRLAASVVWQGDTAKAVDVSSGNACSTPCGIKWFGRPGCPRWRGSR